MNIYQKMSAITQEIATVAKNLSVGDGKSQYKAVSEADVLSAVKPIEAKHGVYSYPVSRRIIDSGEMVSVKEYNGNKSETRRLYLRIETVYRFVNMDKPEEYIDMMTYGDGVDTQDKAPGKGMTYSDKYALLKAYKIQTGDDPDAQASEPLKGVKRKSRKSISAEEAAELRNMCETCGVNIEKLLLMYKVNSFEDMTPDHYAVLKSQLESRINGNNSKN